MLHPQQPRLKPTQLDSTHLPSVQRETGRSARDMSKSGLVRDPWQWIRTVDGLVPHAVSGGLGGWDVTRDPQPQKEANGARIRSATAEAPREFHRILSGIAMVRSSKLLGLPLAMQAILSSLVHSQKTDFGVRYPTPTQTPHPH